MACCIHQDQNMLEFFISTHKEAWVVNDLNLNQSYNLTMKQIYAKIPPNFNWEYGFIIWEDAKKMIIH